MMLFRSKLPTRSTVSEYIFPPSCHVPLTLLLCLFLHRTNLSFLSNKLCLPLLWICCGLHLSDCSSCVSISAYSFKLARCRSFFTVYSLFVVVCSQQARKQDITEWVCVCVSLSLLTALQQYHCCHSFKKVFLTWQYKLHHLYSDWELPTHTDLPVHCIALHHKTQGTKSSKYNKVSSQLAKYGINCQKAALCRAWLRFQLCFSIDAFRNPDNCATFGRAAVSLSYARLTFLM